MSAIVPPGTGDVVLTLTGVRSLTHLVYASSYISSLRAVLDARDDASRIVVDYRGSGAFLGRDAVGDAAAAFWLSADGAADVRLPTGVPADDAAGRHVLLCVGAPGIKPWLRMIVSRRGRLSPVVVIDEGIGSYGTWRTRRAAYLRQGGREPRATIRALAVSAASSLLTAQRWSLYRPDRQGRWQVVPDVASPFRTVARPAAGDHDATVVYLTQPWVELGLISERRYVEHLAWVAAAAREAGIRLAVRPHPSESAERYRSMGDVMVLASGTPAELDPEVLGAQLVLGADSTALLNVAAIHGIPAMRVGLPELDRLEANLAAGQRSLLDTYLPAPVREADVPRILASTRD